MLQYTTKWVLFFNTYIFRLRLQWTVEKSICKCLLFKVSILIINRPLLRQYINCDKLIYFWTRKQYSIKRGRQEEANKVEKRAGVSFIEFTLLNAFHWVPVRREWYPLLLAQRTLLCQCVRVWFEECRSAFEKGKAQQCNYDLCL